MINFMKINQERKAQTGTYMHLYMYICGLKTPIPS